MESEFEAALRAQHQATPTAPPGVSPRFAPMQQVVREAVGYLQKSRVPSVKARLGFRRDGRGWALGKIHFSQGAGNDPNRHTAELVVYEDLTWDFFVDVDGYFRTVSEWPVPLSVGKVTVIKSRRDHKTRLSMLQAQAAPNSALEEWDFWGTPTVGRNFRHDVATRWKTLPDGTTVQDNYDYEWKTWAAYVAERLPLLK